MKTKKKIDIQYKQHTFPSYFCDYTGFIENYCLNWIFGIEKYLKEGKYHVSRTNYNTHRKIVEISDGIDIHFVDSCHLQAKLY